MSSSFRAPSGVDSAVSELVEAVFSAGMLRALDARGRAELSLASRVHELRAGAALFVAGAPADAVFVVARGDLRLDGAVDARTAGAGDVLGWDAALPCGVRSGSAHAVAPSSVVELPLGALRRALTRSGAEELLAREERRARLRAFRALLARTELGAALTRKELDRLVQEAREETLAPGAALGETTRQSAYLVGSGLVALDGGSSGYASRGQLLGLESALGRRSGSERAAALGDVLVAALPGPLLAELARRYPEAVERELASARRREERQARAFGALGNARGTGEPFGRLEAASSLLVIDVATCVDCGHCVRACADTHGAPRFARHGERVTATLDGTSGLAARAYLLPNACQHCRDPACLPECPTGALVRDARGAVEVRAALCTGCGACVSACPWDAVELVPGGTGALAAKCDLCSGREGPECVVACPTGAITRVEPARDFVELRVAVGAPRSSRAERSRLGPWLARAAVLPLLAVALGLAGRADAPVRVAAGWLGAALLLVLAAHAIVKRVPAARAASARALRRWLGARASLAPLVHLHSTLGVLSLAAILVHTGGRLGSGIAGLLSLSYYVLLATGVAGAVLYAALPRRLAALEPEREPVPDAAELDRRLFAVLSGGNDAVRALARGFLVPHARSVAGALALLLSLRKPADEARALTARVHAALGGRASARLTGLDALVQAAVAVRSARAARFGRALLRALVPVHLPLAVLLVALLLLHALGALR